MMETTISATIAYKNQIEFKFIRKPFTSIFFSMYFRLGQHKIFNICPFEFCPENKDNKVFNLSIV